MSHVKSKTPCGPNLLGFVFTERLGSGTYATVYKAYKKSGEQREIHAVKCIQKSRLNHTAMENLLIEIEILKQIDHPHIVRMLDFQWDASYIYIIMEYCGGGDLSHFIGKRRMLPEYIVKRFLQQIASALQLLHDHGISHMDLKPQNILLTSEEQPALKLADFGFAQYLDSSINNALKGSPLYMAPEIITKRRYTAKVDLWSVGVILYECLFGRVPFASNSFVDLENKIKSGMPIEMPSYPKVSDECRALLYGLLQRNPDDRISFDDLFLHPFVDLEHRPSAECLMKASVIVTDAVAKDQEGKMLEAAKLYGDAVEYFVPAIYYESDKQKKEALRQKVKEYITRAEQLRQTHDKNGASEQSVLAQLVQNKPQIVETLQTLQSAVKKGDEGDLRESMPLYEQALERLIALSAKEEDSSLKKYLHNEIDSHLRKAETVREKLLDGEGGSIESPPTLNRHEKELKLSAEDEENTKKCIIQ